MRTKREARSSAARLADLSYISHNARMARTTDPFEQLTGTTAVKSRSKADASRQLAVLDAQLDQYLAKADLDKLLKATHALIAAAASSSRTAREASPVTGETRSSREAVASANRANLLRSFALRRTLLNDTLLAADVADLLGAASRQTPHDRVRSGTLLAVRDAGRLRFPVWQFDPEGPDGVLEGLREVIAALPPQSQLGRVLWFIAPKAQLQGRTPVDLLRDGHVDTVIAEAGAAKAR
jgi:hypothetical protein